VSVTEMLAPRWALGGGLLSELTTRSGAVTVIVAVDVTQLFNSLVSATTFRSSAQAIRKYVPGSTVFGTVTPTVPVEDSPGSSASTDRVPVSRSSEGPFTVSRDRKYRVVEAP